MPSYSEHFHHRMAIRVFVARLEQQLSQVSTIPLSDIFIILCTGTVANFDRAITGML